MDLYVLDQNFVQYEIIDNFVSLIWTDRYSESGELTLVLPEDSVDILKIPEGTFVTIDESNDVVEIDTLSLEDGLWTVTGKMLPDILKSRILRNTWSGAKDAWSIANTPAQCAWWIMLQMCGAAGYMASGLVIPGGTHEPLPNLVSGVLASGTSQTIAVPYGNVYDGVKLCCDQGALGFRLWPRYKPGGYDLVFDAYAGKDLTTDQSVNPVVIFESAMDSLTNIKQVRSIAGYATAAYAWPSGITAQSQIGVAVAAGTSAYSGFQRRTIMVEASDVNVADYTSSELTSIMNQKAKDALANNNYVRLLDGELVPQEAFTYGVDYNLGDIIELRDSSEIAQHARITEYIRSQDSTGETAYPTLSVL